MFTNRARYKCECDSRLPITVHYSRIPEEHTAVLHIGRRGRDRVGYMARNGKRSRDPLNRILLFAFLVMGDVKPMIGDGWNIVRQGFINRGMGKNFPDERFKRRARLSASDVNQGIA